MVRKNNSPKEYQNSTFTSTNNIRPHTTDLFFYLIFFQNLKRLWFLFDTSFWTTNQ